MPKSFKEKPLGAWPNQKKHEAAESLEEKDSETIFGHQPASGSDEVGDVEKIAESMGIYEGTNPKPENPNSGPENPAEVNIAKEIEKNKEG